MQILLVEDDNTLFQELKKELEQWDFNVAGVEDFGNVMDLSLIHISEPTRPY